MDVLGGASRGMKRSLMAVATVERVFVESSLFQKLHPCAAYAVSLLLIAGGYFCLVGMPQSWPRGNGGSRPGLDSLVPAGALFERGGVVPASLLGLFHGPRPIF